MRLDIEGKAAIIAPTYTQIARELKSLRSYGKSSYASLTDDAGNYVQVAGGGVSCTIEQFEFGGERWRGFHDKPSPIRPDGTILVFRAGNIPGAPMMEAAHFPRGFERPRVAMVSGRRTSTEPFRSRWRWRVEGEFVRGHAESVSAGPKGEDSGAVWTRYKSRRRMHAATDYDDVTGVRPDIIRHAEHMAGGLGAVLYL